MVSSLGDINSLILSKDVSGLGFGTQDWAEVPKAAKYIIVVSVAEMKWSIIAGHLHLKP